MVRKNKIIRTGKEPSSSEAFKKLYDSSLGVIVDLDSVNWGAVARSYRILRLHAYDPETFRRNEKLSDDFNLWIMMRGDSVEFDIAMRMYYDETVTAQRFLANI